MKDMRARSFPVLLALAAVPGISRQITLIATIAGSGVPCNSPGAPIRIDRKPLGDFAYEHNSSMAQPKVPPLAAPRGPRRRSETTCNGRMP